MSGGGTTQIIRLFIVVITIHNRRSPPLLLCWSVLVAPFAVVVIVFLRTLLGLNGFKIILIRRIRLNILEKHIVIINRIIDMTTARSTDKKYLFRCTFRLFTRFYFLGDSLFVAKVAVAILTLVHIVLFFIFHIIVIYDEAIVVLVLLVFQVVVLVITSIFARFKLFSFL